MLPYILIGLAVIIVGILIAASMKPNTVHYERSTVINASPEKILPHIADFHNWMAWSPYEKLDPQMKRGFSGADAGKGAKYNWEGNGKVGTGSMEVRDVSNAAVKIDLHFIKPFKTDCAATFTLLPSGTSTTVTWAMEGPNLFMGKAMSVFMNMDKMVGGQFAQGLAHLKAIVEK